MNTHRRTNAGWQLFWHRSERYKWKREKSEFLNGNERRNGGCFAQLGHTLPVSPLRDFHGTEISGRANLKRVGTETPLCKLPLRFYVAYFILKMEAVGSFETEPIYQTTRRHIPEYRRCLTQWTVHLQTYALKHCARFKEHVVILHNLFRVVIIYTTCLNIKHGEFCPHNIFTCFLWFSR
jgi:hypothetical protein